MGQQHDGAALRYGAGAAARTGGATCIGAGAITGRGAGNGLSGWIFVGGGEAGPCALGSGGSVGPPTRTVDAGRSCARSLGSRRIGDGRAVRSSRCALPTIAFFETPSRRPISAVECPCSHSSRSRRIVSSFHTISWSPERLELLDTVSATACPRNGGIQSTHKNLWTTSGWSFVGPVWLATSSAGRVS